MWLETVGNAVILTVLGALFLTSVVAIAVGLVGAMRHRRAEFADLARIVENSKRRAADKSADDSTGIDG